MGHAVGWPFPRGGAARLDRGARRPPARSSAARSRPSTGGRAAAGGLVLADVAPRQLARIAGERLPAAVSRDARRYRHGPGAFKVDWALDGADSLDVRPSARAPGRSTSVARWMRSRRPSGTRGRARLPSGRSSSSRSRAASTPRAPGQHTAWAYCHVPNGSTRDMTDRIEAQVERFAPGFRDRDPRRGTSWAPPISSGTTATSSAVTSTAARWTSASSSSARPRRLVPYRTPFRGVYLCSASTPPGGGVHGMCGYFAARLALRDLRRR